MSTPTAKEGSARLAVGVLLVTCISTLVVNANTSAVTILLPAISADTGMSVDTLQWAVTGYSLIGAATIVTSGALGDVFGRRRLFLIGLALFIASCVMIALAQDGLMVIAGRCIQGASGATILACGMSLIAAAHTKTAQLRAVTLWGAASAIGAAVGPLVGGVLASTTGWQGLFWIDAAIAAACIPLTLASVKESRDPARTRSIDFAGTVLIAVILAPVIFALTNGSTWGWASFATIGCFALSAAAVVAFVLVEQRVKAPLLDLQLLRNPVLVGATIAILLGSGTINAIMYVVSLYFQDPVALGLSPLQAGLATLPVAAAAVVLAPLIPSRGPHRRARHHRPRIHHHDRVLRPAGSCERLVGLRALRASTRRRRGGHEPPERTGILDLHVERPGQPDRRRFGHLEHGPLRRSGSDDGDRRLGVFLGRREARGRRRAGRGCAGGRPVVVVDLDGHLVCPRDRTLAAHGTPPHRRTDRGGSRCGGREHRPHDRDPGHAGRRRARAADGVTLTHPGQTSPGRSFAPA
ncbi:MFS transporter [Microbacterium sp. MYb62]|uniref:MFS transporter n=1 Tax=Microbacterium sp. MYb62 TaxID=1848690 RepID=UPI0021588360|nr:MFS transporter [Microbacterium sp. MYb62]